MSKLSIGILITFLLGGCASAVPVVDFYDMPTETLHQFQRITVAPEVADAEGKLVEIGQVEGIFCRKTLAQPSIDDAIAEAQAVDQVKLKAAKEGADFISVPQCEARNSGDFGNNCFEALICRAAAFKSGGTVKE